MESWCMLARANPYLSLEPSFWCNMKRIKEKNALARMALSHVASQAE
jgi:hypothetical protein